MAAYDWQVQQRNASNVLNTIVITPDPEKIQILGHGAVATSFPALLNLGDGFDLDGDTLSVTPVPGPKGDTGDTGPQGPKGDTGDDGPQGAQGPKGGTGDVGPKGDTGDTGPQGLKGDKGDKGDAGSDGSQGPKGDKGDKGDPGDGFEADPQSRAVTLTSLAAPFTLSSTRAAYVHYTVKFGTTTPLLAGNSYAEAKLSIRAPSGGWQVVDQASAKETVGLTVSVAILREVEASVGAIVPAGWEVKLDTSAGTGGTIALIAKQEVLL